MGLKENSKGKVRVVEDTLADALNPAEVAKQPRPVE